MTGWFIVATVKDTAEKYLLGYIFSILIKRRSFWDLIGNENPCRTTIQQWTDLLYRYMVLRSLEIRGLGTPKYTLGLSHHADLQPKLNMIYVSR